MVLDGSGEVHTKRTYKMEHIRNGELCTAENVRWTEMGSDVSHKKDLAINSEVCNVTYPRWTEADLPASH